MSANCKGCGREIVWFTTEHGSKIPCDPEPFTVVESPYGRLRGFRHLGASMVAFVRGRAPQENEVLHDKGLVEIYTSHFASCTEAESFRR